MSKGNTEDDNNTENTDNNDVDTEKRELKRLIKIDKNVLKTLIIEWLALDEQIKTYKDSIKDMNEEKKQFETKILELMNTLKQDTILTDKGNIIKNVRESKTSLNPELIKTTLSDILKSPETAETYTNMILEKRQIKESVNLKRTDLNKKKVIKKKLDII